MDRHIINVNVGWSGDNFYCVWEDGQDGSVIVTAKTIDKLKKDFAESLQLHIQGCIEDGDSFPQYMINGDYDINYDLDAVNDRKFF